MHGSAILLSQQNCRGRFLQTLHTATAAKTILCRPCPCQPSSCGGLPLSYVAAQHGPSRSHAPPRPSGWEKVPQPLAVTSSRNKLRLQLSAALRHPTVLQRHISAERAWRSPQASDTPAIHLQSLTGRHSGMSAGCRKKHQNASLL